LSTSSTLSRSRDDGVTWQQLHPRGLANETVQALAVDSSDGNALYALLNDGKLYRSLDGGRSFALAAPKVGIVPWAFAVTDKDDFVGGDMDTGAFRSTNGKTWQKTPFTDTRGGRMVMEYAVQPGDGNRVLMTSYGVELSTDAGASWHVALKSNVMFGPVAWAPSKSDVAYAVGFDRSLWRSDDGGKSWTSVS
jgi:photosystem II stability/assembly factor-like uncharacterized protein